MLQKVFLYFLLVSSLHGFGQNNQIVLSSRWFHPKSKTDTLSTLKTVEEFKVNRIDWMYSENETQLALLKNLKIPYSLAINPQIPDSLGYTTLKTRMLDIHGKGYIAPWMKKWSINNPYWGCVNNPNFARLFINKSKKIVDLGSYGIFVDDSRFNDHAIIWGGGCYCNYCIDGFKRFLSNFNLINNQDFNYYSNKDKVAKNGKSYKKLYADFQTESVVNFLKNWKIEISNYANRPFQFITNNANGKWNEIYKVFDSGIAEISLKDNNRYNTVLKTGNLASQLNKKQVFSFASLNMKNNISFYLFCYVNGYEAIIPWDAFIDDKSAIVKRVFIKKEEILPVINFLVKYPQLSKLKTLSAEDIGIKVSSNTLIICKQLQDNTILIFATDKLGNSKKKVTISFSNKVKFQEFLDSKLFPSIKTFNKDKVQISGDLILINYKL